PEVKKTDAIDLAYFELSHLVSAALAPLLNGDKQAIGILFCESTIENFFGAPIAGKPELPPPQSLAQWIGLHAGRSIAAARDSQTLPLLRPMRKARDLKLALTGKHRNRFLLKTTLITGALVIAALWPMRRR